MGHTSSKVTDVATLQVGDHILIWDQSLLVYRYQHHGIVRATGKTAKDVIVAHIWSHVKSSRRESQQDSRWMLTTLEEFLWERPIRDLRVVQYYSSLAGEISMKLGESHMAQSDNVELVIARCDWLLGQGANQFRLFAQNCEHAAHWCKTGRQWSKQVFVPRSSLIPFPVPRKYEQTLFSELDVLKKEQDDLQSQWLSCLQGEDKKLAQEELDGIALSIISSLGSGYQRNLVHLKVGRRYVAVGTNNHLLLIKEGEELPAGDIAASREQRPAVFAMTAERRSYNEVFMSFQHIESGGWVYAPPLWQVARPLRIARRGKRNGKRRQYRSLLFKNAYHFIFNQLGQLQSLHHDRCWVVVDGKKSDQLVMGHHRHAAPTFDIEPALSFLPSQSPEDEHRVETLKFGYSIPSYQEYLLRRLGREEVKSKLKENLQRDFLEEEIEYLDAIERERENRERSDPPTSCNLDEMFFALSSEDFRLHFLDLSRIEPECFLPDDSVEEETEERSARSVRSLSEEDTDIMSSAASVRGELDTDGVGHLLQTVDEVDTTLSVGNSEGSLLVAEYKEKSTVILAA